VGGGGVQRAVTLGNWTKESAVVMHAMGRARGIAFGMVAGLALLLTGCGGSSVFDLEVGTCFNDEGETGTEQQVSSVPTVDCDEPHDNEVFAVVDLPDGEFPTDVAAQAQEICDGEVFTEYLGIPMLESEYSALTIYPTSETWADGDREVVCALYRDDLQRMTGLQRGAAAEG